MEESGLSPEEVAVLREKLEVIKEMFEHLPVCHKCHQTPFCAGGAVLFGRANDRLDEALKMVSLTDRPPKPGTFKLKVVKGG